MANKVTKFELMTALFTGGPLLDLETVNVVAREDGSGHKFNVTGYRVDGTEATKYVVTVD